jgi:hypothetical protein
MKTLTFTLLALLLTLSACAGSMEEPANNDEPVSSESPSIPPTEPLLSLDSFERGPVYLDSADLLRMESFPVQFMLSLTGNLPTPCHQLQVVASPPDADNRVMVEVYSVVDPGVMCAQVLAPFEVNHPLGSFPEGKYTLWVNGEMVVEFES